MHPLAQSTLPHRHSFNEIFWIEDGAGYHHIDFQSYPVRPNSLFFITPGQVHYWQVERPVTGYALLFTAEFLLLNHFDQTFWHNLEFLRPNAQPPIIYPEADRAEQFSGLCQNLLNEFQGDSFGRTLAIQAFLQLLLVQAQRSYAANSSAAAPGAPQRLVQQLHEAIEQHFQTVQSVREYADLLGVTPNHLGDVTRQLSGQSPGTLIRQRLVLEAKRLLSHSPATIGEIAADLNFTDPAYFSRFFRRETGQSPEDFRRTFREKYQTNHFPAL